MSPLRLVLAAALALTLAACGSRHEVRVLGDGDALGTASPHAGTGSEDVAALPPRPLPTAEEIAAAPDPLTLKGEAADAVRAALGPASLLRREPPAQVWQYRGRTCVLDVVLYPDEAEGAPLTVAHVELRPVVAANAVAPKACAADVLQNRMARS
ncbi:hypothetical protein C882_4355 [Caenispirillum salinarum AK4]|uniref:Lipoprotein n=1 Tax=Caenispirillum salinarum AK4 TaxID=1238182 RepID=K9HPG7_9PROT|nr:hypothetical protein [Caenispirillum salinarum]EKV30396.1 hypothetical protein C882_4355 [Caenispirillum salinarum AK4]